MDESIIEDDHEGSDPSSEAPGGPDPAAPPSEAENEFSKLLQYASAIKSSQPEVREARKRWDSMPFYLKNTLLFSMDDEIRKNFQFKDKLAFAANLKNSANELFREKKLDEASSNYQRAYGIFRFAVKTKSEHGDVVDENDTTNNLPTEEFNEVHKLLVSCLINMAACELENNHFDEVISACNGANELIIQNSKEPNNISDSLKTKLFYRKALALKHRDLLDEAILAAKEAVRLSPGDEKIQSLLTSLKSEKKSDAEKAKQTFSGLFERSPGSISSVQERAEKEKEGKGSQSSNNNGSGPGPGAGSGPGGVSATERFMKDYVQRYRNLQNNQYKTPQDEAAAHAQTMNDLKRMKEGAEKFGLDLSDSGIQEELRNLQEQQQKPPTKTSQKQDKLSPTKESTFEWKIGFFMAFLSIGSILYAGIL